MHRERKKQVSITILTPLRGRYQKQQIGGKYLRRIKITNLIFFFATSQRKKSVSLRLSKDILSLF